MSEKQNPKLVKDDSSPLEGEPSGGQNDPSPKSYYYDDSTGYEIYKEENDDDDDEETS
jgi:hypothetical protein